ncbi:hypothetical protein MRX96_044702 [Rhipicephalus microplus]
MTTVGHPRWVGLCVYISGVRFRGPIAKPQPLHVPWNSSGSATGCTDLVKPYTVESPAAAREIRHVQVFLLQQVRHAASAALLHSVPEVTRVSNNSARNFLLSTEVHASSTDTPGGGVDPHHRRDDGQERTPNAAAGRRVTDTWTPPPSDARCGRRLSDAPSTPSPSIVHSRTLSPDLDAPLPACFRLSSAFSSESRFAEQGRRANTVK